MLLSAMVEITFLLRLRNAGNLCAVVCFGLPVYNSKPHRNEKTHIAAKGALLCCCCRDMSVLESSSK